MNNREFILLEIILLLCLMVRLDGQISPRLDANWVMNDMKSDEFNSEMLDTTKWDALDPSNGIGYHWGGGQLFRPENVSLNGNYLQLKVEDYHGNDRYYSGGIQSADHDYSYGYFEIRAKLPGDYDENGNPVGEGFWPAFWTYYVETDSNGCRTLHDEIDILEPSGSQYADAKTNVSGWHDESPNCDIDHVKVSGHVWYNHSEPLFEDYHEYAVEWLPDRIIFYFDGKPYYAEYGHPKMVMKPQFVVIDQQVDGNLSIPYLNQNIRLPQYMSVDYFRYYELDYSSYTETSRILNQFQLDSFYYGVRNNIFIGNGSSSISVTTGDNLVLRAINDITIEGEFTVPLGSALNLVPTPSK